MWWRRQAQEERDCGYRVEVAASDGRSQLVDSVTAGPHPVVAFRAQPLPAHHVVFRRVFGPGASMSSQLSPVLGLTLLNPATSQSAPGTARVAVFGEVDLFTAADLRDRLLEVVGERIVAVLEVDFAGVTFLDCCGVGALLAVRDIAVRTGGRLRVTNPQPIVRLLLDLVGVLDVLTAPVDGGAAARRLRSSGGLADGLRGEHRVDLVE
jgi:anti-anti-sigma factor